MQRREEGAVKKIIDTDQAVYPVVAMVGKV